MEVFVGTSGWSYGWNRGGNLDWYLKNSRLNAVELNASFYRFPYKNQIAGWARKGAELRWCVKVHRFITHQHKFNETARGVWQRFLDLFSPLDPSIDYYLFQAPPSMTDIDRLLRFFDGLPLLEKCVLEIRNRNLISDDAICRKLQDCLPVVSVDSPDTKNRIFSSNLIYMRMHGREDWYRHDYMQEELEETAGLIRTTGAEKVYLFFNNDNSMLENAQRMMDLFRSKGGGLSPGHDTDNTV
jgi:uncharacterized protein YecE (DUF72 family)